MNIAGVFPGVEKVLKATPCCTLKFSSSLEQRALILLVDKARVSKIGRGSCLEVVGSMRMSLDLLGTNVLGKSTRKICLLCLLDDLSPV